MWLLVVQLLCTVKRIESFAVTSPLTRFITGLELLLQSAQMWDRDAPTTLKLTDKLMPVVELIKRWRKIEYRFDNSFLFFCLLLLHCNCCVQLSFGTMPS